MAQGCCAVGVDWRLENWGARIGEIGVRSTLPQHLWEPQRPASAKWRITNWGKGGGPLRLRPLLRAGSRLLFPTREQFAPGPCFAPFLPSSKPSFSISNSRGPPSPGLAKVSHAVIGYRSTDKTAANNAVPAVAHRQSLTCNCGGAAGSEDRGKK